jgi:hypothetical protein
MYSKVKSVVALMLFFLLAACSTADMYTKPEFADVTKTHKRVAILPFAVSFDAKSISKDFTVEAAKKAEKDESTLFQKSLYTQFLKREKEGKYTVAFQDVDETNTLLSKAGITYDNMSSFTKAELASKLGVDAVISGSIHRSKPMSTTGAVVMTLLVGFGGNTNKVNVNMALHNGSNGDLLWKYDNDRAGGLGSSSEEIAKSLMNNISKNFPYMKKTE